MTEICRIVLVAGARPNFMKVAPILKAMGRWNRPGFGPAGSMPHGVSPSAARLLFWPTLVHTGQHYDPGMSDVFFRELDLPEPHHHLGCGSGSHAEQTAAVMRGFERILLDGDLCAVPGRSPDGLPDLVLVVGDVNSTLAAALVCAKLHVPVAHVEAGLRSRDWSMPEEVNRILTDHCCQLLFTTSRDADENLRAEGIAAERVRFVGNTMIDSLDRVRASAAYGSSDVLRRLALDPRGYCVATLHRPSNVDAEEDLRRVLAVLAEVARHVPVVYPVHPRARARVSHLLDPCSQAAAGGAAGDSGRRGGGGAAGDSGRHAASAASPGGRAASAGDSGRRAASAAPRIRLIDPLGYLDFLTLLEHARLVVTDSGGVQEETTVLGVPCLTARETTERPITITQGTNRLIPPSDPDGMLVAVGEVLAATEPAAISSSEPTFGYTPRRPELWDGRAGERIVGEIAEWFASR
jgi:UDP-N-acetylglucosamine 2-epimerase (non-hydrolysing)